MATASLISFALYVNGAPIFIENKEHYLFKKVLELNEQAISMAASTKGKHIVLNDDASTVAFIESLIPKKGDVFLIMLAQQNNQLNPILIEDMYLQPAQELLRQVIGVKSLSSTTAEAIQKGIKKNQHEIESAFHDLLSGLDMSSTHKGSTSVPRLGKKATDFYEYKYPDIENRFKRQLEVLQQKPKSADGHKLELQKVILPVPKEEEIKQLAKVSNQPKAIVVEKLEMIMESQQISQAAINGIITIEGEPRKQIQITVDDSRWADKSKIQAQVNPNLKVEYSQQQNQHQYTTSTESQVTTLLQYKVNPQLLSELPILVMWTNTKTQSGLLFHMKYLINQKFTSFVNTMVFNIGVPIDIESNKPLQINQNDLALIQQSKDYSKVELTSQTVSSGMRLTLASGVYQGIVEFTSMSGTIIKCINVEISLKGKLISDISSVTIGGKSTANFRSDLVIKMINQSHNQFT